MGPALVGRREPLILFLAAFVAALLGYHACGGLAPFRDAGEFAVAAQHLTIAHPPGYPFYTLLGKLWVSLIPWGSAAYRLNLLSAFSSAGALALGILWLRRSFKVSLLTAGMAFLLLISSRIVLTISFVSEMFSVGLLFLLALLSLTDEARASPHRLLPAGLILPLGLGVRLDLAFASVYALALIPIWWRPSHRKVFFWSLAFLALGATVFLYLPIRSFSFPLVNWGDPSTLDRVFNGLFRRSYGSTVDLISLSYKSGELFWDGAWHWLKVFWEAFGPLTLAAPFGIFFLAKQGRALSSVLCWALTGPVFILLANMPPNPHAIKILEDHFLPSLVMACLWIAVGLEGLVQEVLSRWPALNQKPGLSKAFTGVAWAGLLAVFAYRAQDWSLRRDFYAYDYFVNVARSAPRDSIAVLHEDVQLFTSWEAILNRGRRRDLKLVAQGLSGSPWYQKCLRELWGYGSLVIPSKLENPAAWNSLLAANAGAAVLAGFETDSGSPEIRKIPHGLLTRLCRGGGDSFCSKGSQDIWPVLALRGSYRQDEEKFFFNQDLIEDYARAAFEFGNFLLRAGQREDGLRFLKKALSLRPLMAQAAVLLAFDAFDQSHWEEALFWWTRAQAKIETLLEMARQYRTLPDVLRPMKKDMSYVLTSTGVTLERLGKDLAQIAPLHQESIRYDPDSALAHFNLAATYWKMRDLAGAKKEFAEVLRLDPNHAQARQYLSRLKEL